MIVKKDPRISSIEIPERIGKTTSCLFSLKTFKLVIVIFHPFAKRSKKFISVWFLLSINIIKSLVNKTG